MAAFPGFAQAVLSAGGFPVTPQNVAFLNTWHQYEQSPDANNPLNTSLHIAGGSNPTNAAGVQNYSNPQIGTHATVATINNGYYPNIVAALKSGNPATYKAAIAKDLQTWGSHSFANYLTGSGVQPIDTTTPTNLTPPPALPQAPSTQPSIQAQRPTSPLADPVVQAIVASNDKLLGVQAPNFAAIPSSTGQLTYKVAGKVTPTVRNALALAEDYLGTPYSYGGGGASGPTYGINQGAHTRGFDCSGLLQYMWARAGVSIPRTTYKQFQTGTPVPRSQLQPGDAVFFTGSDPQNGLPGHVGIYVGGGKILQAPHTGANVEITPLSSMPGYQGARRYS